MPNYCRWSGEKILRRCRCYAASIFATASCSLLANALMVWMSSQPSEPLADRRASFIFCQVEGPPFSPNGAATISRSYSPLKKKLVKPQEPMLNKVIHWPYLPTMVRRNDPAHILPCKILHFLASPASETRRHQQKFLQKGIQPSHQATGLPSCDLVRRLSNPTRSIVI